MTKNELKQWIQNDITLSGALSGVSLPDNEIKRVIEKETMYVADKYPEAIETKFCIIHPHVFMSPEFRANRCIQFPSCVRYVTKFEEMRRRNNLIGLNDPDVGFNRAFMTEMWQGMIANFDSLTYRLVHWSAWDQFKQFTLVDIQHTWNRNTHRLYVKGHTPQIPVYCELSVQIPDEDLWEDPWVKMFLSAKCKLQVARLLGTFTHTLIGGVTINQNTYSDGANNDIKECEEYWKDMTKSDNSSWFLEAF